MYVSEYGLNENDVVFVELKNEDGWAFHLDYNEPKYFDPGVLKNPGAINDEPSYRKYWEAAFSRTFPSLESPAQPPEYSRLKKILHSVTEKDHKTRTPKPDKPLLSIDPIPVPALAPAVEKMLVDSSSKPEFTVAPQKMEDVKANVAQEASLSKVAPVNGSSAASTTTSGAGSAYSAELECTEVLKLGQTLGGGDTPEKIRIPPTGDDLMLTVKSPQPFKVEVNGSSSRNGTKIVLMSPVAAYAVEPPLESKPVVAQKVKAARPSGIKNIGNTCYISSSIQCLKHTKLLWEFVESYYGGKETADTPSGSASDGEISKSFSELVQSLKDDNQSIAPHQFKKVVAAHSAQFSGTEQSDAHEFLTFLIDKLHEELKGKDTAGGAASKIEEIFYGAFRSTIQCLQCGHHSVSKEPFMCISLPIEGNIDILNVILYTQSNHLLIVNFKYDDDSMTVQSVKEELQKQVIVGPLDIFLLINGSTLIPIADSKTIGDITRCKESWQLYAVERQPDSSDFLLKVGIAKHSPPFLMSSQLEPKEHVYALTENVRRLFLGAGVPGNDIDSTAAGRSLAQTLDFGVTDMRPVASEESALKYDVLELKPTVKASDIKQLWGKLPQKHITAVKHKAEEESFGTLHGCLSRFTGTEKLQGNNQWMCPNCKSFKDANKAIEYLKLPKVLIIHLKRFKVFGKKSRSKISTLVKFPLILLLNTTDGTTHMYNLYAMMNHMGDIERGHYTAYCRNLKNRNEWLEFDDNKVRPIDATQLETNKAYVLFYEHT